MIGFTGKAHYVSNLNMEYSGMLHLPVETLRKIGAVAKVNTTDRLDFEVTITAAEKRVSCVFF